MQIYVWFGKTMTTKVNTSWVLLHILTIKIHVFILKTNVSIFMYPPKHARQFMHYMQTNTKEGDL